MKAENSDKKEFVLPIKSTIQTEKCGQNLFFESSGEFTLPDYMPKVEKLLRTESKVLPPLRFVASNEVIMSGNVLHSLIYVGDEGEVSATVLPTKYEASIPFANKGEEREVIAQPVLESASCRASAPRKVNVRSKLRALPHTITKIDVTPTLPDDTDGINMLFGEIDSVCTKNIHLDNITVSETVEISAPAEARLIWCGANAAVTDIRTTDGGVQIRGDVFVKLLTSMGGEAKMHCKKIPFEEFCDAELARKTSVSAIAKVVSTEAAREQGTDALVDVVLALDITMDTPENTSVVFDAFSEKFDAAVEYRKIPTSKLALCRSGVYSAGGSIPKSSLAGFDEMLDTSGEAILEEVRNESGRLILSGRCNMNSVYKTENGGYSSAEYTLPFKLAWDIDTKNETENTASVSLVSVRTRTDGENIVCDMDIAASVRGFEEDEKNVLRSVSLDGAKPYEKSEYPLCLIYPGGESLWMLAKKYRVSPEKLAKINSISISENEYTSPEALSKSKILMLQI